MWGKVLNLKQFLLFALLISSSADALEAKFLGVSSMLLSDGTDQILFDAPFSRPGPLQWLNLLPFKSDSDLVMKVLNHHKITQLRAVFVSHMHVDHSVDVALVSKLTGANAFGDENLGRIIPKTERELVFKKMEEGVPIKIGQFSIRPFRISHGEIPFEFLFSGEVAEDFNYSLYDYKEGGTWFYLINHGEKKIIWNGSTGDALSVLKAKGEKVEGLDLYVLGMGVDSLRKKIDKLQGNHPFKEFVPVHFDNFFLPYDLDEFTYLPFSEIEKDIKDLEAQFPKVKWNLPKLGRAYEIQYPSKPVFTIIKLHPEL